MKEGDLYNESALERAQRGLFATEAFRFVGVKIDSASLQDPADSLVTVGVELHESTLLATRASVGWANLDCLRAQVNHTNYNFLGLRRLDLNGRISKVGTSYPTEWAQGFCTSELLDDEVSDTLNYYLGGQISQAALFGLRIVPTLLVYTERRSEFKAYLRDTKIGVIASAQQGLGGRLPMTWSYQLEYGQTSAQPAFFCAVFNVCEAAVRERLEQNRRSAVLGWAATRTRALPSLVSPVTGSVMRVELRHASPLVGSTPDESFNRATFDGSWYRPAFGGILVTRFRAGAVFGTRLGTNAPTFIPLTERLYAGGPNSVRGFRQNEMGPAIYVPDGFTAEPVSGNDSTLQYWRADPDSGRRAHGGVGWRQRRRGKRRAADAQSSVSRAAAVRDVRRRGAGLESWTRRHGRQLSRTYSLRRASGCVLLAGGSDPHGRGLQPVSTHVGPGLRQRTPAAT